MPISRPNPTIPKSLLINLADYCKIDGISDDSAGFTYAYKLAGSRGMGLWHPGGVLVKGNDTILSNVPLLGVDPNTSIYKLKNNANTDLFSANTGNINLSSAYGVGAQSAINGFSMQNITLDGNKAGQSGTSYPLRFYGKSYLFQNLNVKNGVSGGILCDYNGTEQSIGPEEASRFLNVQVFDCGGVGIKIGGPTDTHLIDVSVYRTGTHCIHICPNAGGLQASNCHVWGPLVGVSGGALGWLLESQCYLSNCESEGSDTAQIAVLAGQVGIQGGRIFAGSQPGVGVQIGQANGATAFPGQIQANTGIGAQDYNIRTFISDITATNGSLYFANDGGRGHVDCFIRQFSSNYYTGSLSGTTFLVVHGAGLTPDGTQGKGGTVVYPINAYSAFVMRDDNFTDIYNINTNSKYLQLPNSTQVKMYSDAYSTLTLQLIGGTVCLGQSASAPALATSGTITTAGVGSARVAPTGNVTGIILQAGTTPGQQCEVVNESAFTITFAVVGTSLVADGTSAVIAANRKMSFVWDSGTSKWYHS
jgi:hypothetical protein